MKNNRPLYNRIRAYLSDREFEILICLPTNLEYAQIGDLYGLKENTIKYYVQEIYKKLGVHSRHAASVVAIAILDDKYIRELLQRNIKPTVPSAKKLIADTETRWRYRLAEKGEL